VRGTHLLRVSATAAEARAAAEAANARARALVDRVEASATADLDAELAMLAGEISQQQGVLARGEREYLDVAPQLAAFGLTGGRGSRVARLSDRLDVIQRQQVPLDAAMQRVAEGAEPGTIWGVVLDPHVTAAREAVLAVERERARGLLRYEEQHPAIERLDEFVARARDNLRFAEDAIVTSLWADRDRLMAEASALRGALDTAIVEQLDAAPVRARLRTLTAGITEARRTLGVLHARDLDIRQARGRAGGGLRIVEPAVPSAAPLPGPGRWVSTVAVLLLAFGILLRGLASHHRPHVVGPPGPVLLHTHSWPPSAAVPGERRAA
jgi:uncharacterized protein involved in exopolysaccharide biosynthesis